MDIKHKIYVDTPSEFVYDKITDVESLLVNLPSNVILRSENGSSSFEVGSRWNVRIQRTGRKFALKTEITDVIEGEYLEFSTTSNRIKSHSSIRVTTIDENASLIDFTSKITPNGLLGRILIQSLKASRGRVNQRLEKSGEKLKDYLEEAYHA